MKLLIVVLLGVAAIQRGDARQFSRGGLAYELLRQGFPRHQLAEWVCLVEAESSRRTNIKGPTTDGYTVWGLFQIMDGYWCRHGYRGGGCHMKCEDLLTDDITAAANCAKYIYSLPAPYGGFAPWEGWRDKCQNGLPDLSKFNLPSTYRIRH